MTLGQRSWNKAMRQANERARISGERQTVTHAVVPDVYTSKGGWAYFVRYHPLFPVIRERR